MRRQIPQKHAARVDEVEGLANLPEDGDEPPEVTGLEVVVEEAARAVLHREEVAVAGDHLEVVDLDDVRVAKLGEHAEFLLESSDRASVLRPAEQAQGEASRITATAHTQIEAEKQQVLAQLKTEVGTLATSLAGRIVGESLEEETRQRGIVERFLAELESGDVVREKVGSKTEDA